MVNMQGHFSCRGKLTWSWRKLINPYLLLAVSSALQLRSSLRLSGELKNDEYFMVNLEASPRPSPPPLFLLFSAHGSDRA